MGYKNRRGKWDIVKMMELSTGKYDKHRHIYSGLAKTICIT